MALRFDKVKINGTTGHMEVHVRYAEKNGDSVSFGVMKSHGISPTALQEKFNGDTQLWLASIHKEMKKNHEAMKPYHDTISKLVGTTVEF